MEIKETLGGDEKSWGLWHEHRGSLRKYTLQGRSSLVRLSWLKDLKQLQQRSSLTSHSTFSGCFLFQSVLSSTQHYIVVSYGDVSVCVFSGPPVFEKLLSDCTTKIGQTVKLSCKVAGSPTPVVSWLRGQKCIIKDIFLSGDISMTLVPFILLSA